MEMHEGMQLLSSDEVDLVLRYSKHELDNLGSGCNYMFITMTPLSRQSKPALSELSGHRFLCAQVR